MYHRVISQCTQSLKNLETCLYKAEQHAAAKKFDVGVLMTSRLAPDMQHFIYQVQVLAIMSKPRLPGSQGNAAPSTKTTSIRSTNCVLVSGRPSLSLRA